MSLNLLCIVISLIILLALMQERDRRSKMNRLFRFFVLCNIGIISSDTVAWLMNGNMAWYAFYLVRASNFLHFMFGPLILAAMTIYMLAYISLKTKIKRIIPLAVYSLCGLSLFLTVVSQFTGMYYIIDENNVYHRQDFFWLSQALPIAGLAMNMVIIVFYRKVMLRKAALFFLSYMAVPIIAMSIQYMFYGITLVNVGTTLTMLIFYIGVQTELAIDLESTIAGINRQLELKESYYKMLWSHVEETKAARHDLRHYLTVVQSYINSDDKEQLKAYLNQHIRSLPADEEIMFCENFAVNAVISYYVGIAKSEAIQVETHFALPKQIRFNDSDLCIIFGNCIENAIEACRKLDGEKFIKINSMLTGKMLTITIDNNFDGNLEKEEDTFLSLKREGKGVGILSVKAIAKKYDGTARFESDGNNFNVSILLHATDVILRR